MLVTSLSKLKSIEFLTNQEGDKIQSLAANKGCGALKFRLKLGDGKIQAFGKR